MTVGKAVAWAVVTAAFFAVMLGGPLLFIPGHAALFSPLVCEEGQTVEALYGSPNQDGARSVEFCCKKGDECIFRTLRVTLTAIGFYFVAIMVLILIYALVLKLRHRRRE